MLDEDAIEQMSNSEVHRLYSADIAVHAIFSEMAKKARTRLKRLQSILSKRGHLVPASGEYDPNDLRRPALGAGVSEHAMLRYLERVMGMDLRAIEAEILERVKAGDSYYSGAVVIDKEGVSYIMRDDGLVKSIMPQEWLDENDGICAERSYRLQRREEKADHFRKLAAQGLDTDPRARETKRAEN